jgi:hypothetical protein
VGETELEITDEMLQEIAKELAEEAITKMEHPYVFDLIKVLAPYPNGLRRMIALDWLRSTRLRLGLPIPPTFDETVQASLQYYCRDSTVFKNRNAPSQEAIFCWPKGKRAGVWVTCPWDFGPPIM